MIDLLCLGLPDLVGYTCHCHEFGLMAVRALSIFTVEEQELRSRCAEFGRALAEALWYRGETPVTLAEKVYGTTSPFATRLMERFLDGERLDPAVARRIAAAMKLEPQEMRAIFGADEPNVPRSSCGRLPRRSSA